MKGLVVPYLGDLMVGIHAFCGFNARFHEFCQSSENIRQTGIFDRKKRGSPPVQRLTWWFFPMQTGEYLNGVWVCGTSKILLPTQKLHTLVVCPLPLDLDPSAGVNEFVVGENQYRPLFHIRSIFG